MELLPESFKDRMKKLVGDDYKDFEECFSKKHNQGLRVNTLKVTPENFKACSPYAIEPVPWIKNGFYYDEKEQPSRHPYYFAGLYYIQEPSAMTPASLLPVKPGDRVLDLCAAPGGKSTELGAKLMGEGLLVANDISNSRAKALLKNIEMFGIANAVVISDTPAKLAGSFHGYFDKVLVDAPCSGEGMFRKSHSIIKNWEQYGVEYYVKLQREILPFAISMLRPGGYMVYSTCTFSPEEDEGALQFILENYPDMHVVKAAKLDEPEYKGFCIANPELVNGNSEISNGIRIYPHRVRGEGHFVSLLRKDNKSGVYTYTEQENIYGKELRRGRKTDDTEGMHNSDGIISSEAEEFLNKISFSIDKRRIFVKEDRLYHLPEGLCNTKGLRVMRSGLLLGEMKKNRFEPSQALAMALRTDQYDNIYNLAGDSQEVIRYLKCESLSIPDNQCSDGWVLVCTDGYPLGWAKKSGSSLKNKYLAGWRWI